MTVLCPSRGMGGRSIQAHGRRPFPGYDGRMVLIRQQEIWCGIAPGGLLSFMSGVVSGGG